MINVKELSFEDKVNLLKDLVDDLDIVLTACYGATGYITSKDIDILSVKDEIYNEIKKETVVIHTGINTG